MGRFRAKKAFYNIAFQAVIALIAERGRHPQQIFHRGLQRQSIRIQRHLFREVDRKPVPYRKLSLPDQKPDRQRHKAFARGIDAVRHIGRIRLRIVFRQQRPAAHQQNAVHRQRKLLQPLQKRGDRSRRNALALRRNA